MTSDLRYEMGGAAPTGTPPHSGCPRNSWSGLHHAGLLAEGNRMASLVTLVGSHRPSTLSGQGDLGQGWWVPPWPAWQTGFGSYPMSPGLPAFVSTPSCYRSLTRCQDMAEGNPQVWSVLLQAWPQAATPDSKDRGAAQASASKAIILEVESISPAA